MHGLLEGLKSDAERHGKAAIVVYQGRADAVVRPDAFRRCLANLVGNAQRYANAIALPGIHDGRTLTVHVDDDGPGIPADLREDAFRPFYRLDEARNQDEAAPVSVLRSRRHRTLAWRGYHAGQQPFGGLRATVTVPA